MKDIDIDRVLHCDNPSTVLKPNDVTTRRNGPRRRHRTTNRTSRICKSTQWTL